MWIVLKNEGNEDSAAIKIKFSNIWLILIKEEEENIAFIFTLVSTIFVP